MEGHLVVRREVNELHDVDLAPSGPVRSLCPEAGPYLKEKIQLKAFAANTEHAPSIRTEYVLHRV